MHRLAIRPLAKVSLAHAAPRVSRATRFLSTAPPHRQSRSWKNSLFRWGLAGAIVYYYNTSSVFADEPQYATHRVPEPPRSAAPSYARDSNVEQARRRNERDEPTDTQSASLATSEVTEEQSAIASPEELEAEAGQQGAFNEETGEINWDCPCLGGMAYGPCGEQFRAAFSCFVFSKEDPKGIECIDHFKTMQNCFREHPDIYGSELEEDEVADAIDADTSSAPSPARSETDASHGPRSSEVAAGHADAKPSAEKDVKEARGRAQATAEQVRKDYQPADGKDNLVPRAAHDAR